MLRITVVVDGPGALAQAGTMADFEQTHLPVGTPVGHAIVGDTP